MARNFKNKPKDMKISVYLIHTRLLAQGTVIGKLSSVPLTPHLFSLQEFSLSEWWTKCIRSGARPRLDMLHTTSYWYILFCIASVKILHQIKNYIHKIISMSSSAILPQIESMTRWEAESKDQKKLKCCWLIEWNAVRLLRNIFVSSALVLFSRSLEGESQSVLLRYEGDMTWEGNVSLII